MVKVLRFVVVAFAVIAVGNLSLPTARAEISQEEFEKMFNKYVNSEKGREVVGKATQAYFRSLQEKARKEQEEKRKAELEAQFKNPVKIDIGKAPVKGPADAKITIIEFSDFQCPFCKRGTGTLKKVMESYPKDVKIAFKNLPLPFHKNALGAAKAALAAGKQGKFWEMHDELFANQQSLGMDFYVKTAKKLGLDVEKFKKDMEDPEIAKQIEEDKQLANKLGIRGTPGFFVNGVAIKGAYPFKHFKMIIDRWLKKLG
ncbi:MAG: disulfide bond formation protein DsbA [Candidatus Dadabacteria bacterium]|nr:MAG: disulfide bond formation protein DsbA [Candidatus Dadabacteria bacterium]